MDSHDAQELVMHDLHVAAETLRYTLKRESIVRALSPAQMLKLREIIKEIENFVVG